MNVDDRMRSKEQQRSSRHHQLKECQDAELAYLTDWGG